MVDVHKYWHLQGLDLVTRNVRSVNLLIGQDNAEDLLPLLVKRGEKGDPYAVKTLFGWCVNGVSHTIPNRVPNCDVVTHFVTSSTKEGDINKLWDLENQDLQENSISWSHNDHKVPPAAIGTMSFKGCPAFISSAESSVVRVRVHWAHYYVPMQMITEELGKYVEEVGEAGYEQAPGNFESTKSLVRGFMCKVKNIETVPQTITIDLDGEKCNEPWHERRQCEAPKCKLCQAVGHTREECSRGYAARAARNSDDNVVKENMDLHEEDREEPSGDNVVEENMDLHEEDRDEPSGDNVEGEKAGGDDWENEAVADAGENVVRNYVSKYPPTTPAQLPPPTPRPLSHRSRQGTHLA